MKRAVLVGAILLIGATSSGSQPQVCSQGLVIRSGGAVIIDSWQHWEGPIAIPGSAQRPEVAVYPKTVMFGKSLNDDVRIQIETDAGMKFVSLKALRAWSETVK